jgi:hypothetical protein
VGDLGGRMGGELGGSAVELAGGGKLGCGDFAGRGGLGASGLGARWLGFCWAHFGLHSNVSHLNICDILVFT